MSCQVLRTGNVRANDAYSGVACNGHTAELAPPRPESSAGRPVNGFGAPSARIYSLLN